MFELHFTHNTCRAEYKAVGIYAFKLYSEQNNLGKPNETSISGVLDIRPKNRYRKDEWEKNIKIKQINKNVFLTIPYGTNYITFEDNEIEIQRSTLGEPQGSEGTISIMEYICIRSRTSMEILVKFLKDAVKFYRMNLIDTDKEKNKTVCWLLDDDYWMKLNTHEARSIDTIYLEKSKKDKIIRHIQNFLDKKTLKRYNELGIRYKKNILLAGWPGTGKSSLAYALAHHFKKDVAMINFGPSITDGVLWKALTSLPKDTILLLEDIDCLFIERGKGDEYKKMVTLMGLLNCLDGVCYRQGLITIMTTNFKDQLDMAFKRPGRIDYILEFDYSTKSEVQMMFDKFYPKNDNFKEFYSKIQSLKFTMAVLQEFFLEHIDGKNLIKDVEIFRERVRNIKYGKDRAHLYT